MVLIEEQWHLAIAIAKANTHLTMKINLKNWIVKAAILGFAFGAGFMITYLVVTSAQ
jgi:hypothetical protein